VNYQAVKFFRYTSVALLIGMSAVNASAGLFEDEDARKAILELRQRVDAVRLESTQIEARTSEDSALLRRSLLDLQNQIESMRTEMAKLRGVNEQLTRDVADVQRRQKDIAQGVDERLRQFEPIKVTLDGREFMAEPLEKRDFEVALGIFRKGDFPEAQTAFISFLKRFPNSGYWTSSMFWLANAQYATRDYKEAIVNFSALVAKSPDHLRAPESMLSIGNCQIEVKDVRAAKKTLETLVKTYPQSEAAVAAKERLVRLK
jgi:tol-pal system protein YbgF